MNAFISPDSVIISRAEYDRFKTIERQHSELTAKDQLHRLQDDIANGRSVSHCARFLTRDGLIAYGELFAPVGTPIVERVAITNHTLHNHIIATEATQLMNKSCRVYRLVDTCLRTGRRIYQEQ